MESFRDKHIRESVEKFFKGVDDEVLKSIVLYTALGKSDEEKDALCEQIRKKQEEDLQYFNDKFEIEITKDTPPETLKLINPEVKIEGHTDVKFEITDVIENEKSNDIIEHADD